MNTFANYSCRPDFPGETQESDWVISVGTGEDSIPLILAAQRLGFKVVALGADPSAVAEHNIVHTLFDAPGCCQKVLSNFHRYKAVVSRTTGPGPEVAALLAESLNLPGYTRKFAKASRKKIWLFRHAADRGVPTIPTLIYHPGLDLDTTYPLVLKPNEPRRGKTGLSLVDSKEGLQGAWRVASENSVDTQVVAQPFISGDDLGEIVCVVDGEISWSQQFLEHTRWALDGLHFEGLDFRIPRTLLGSARDAAQTTALLFRGSSYTGFATVSYRIPADQRVLAYELNLGLGGDKLVEDTLSRSNPDIDFFVADVKTALGLRVFGN